MASLGCVIISNVDDFRFLKTSLREIAPLFKHIVISIGDSLWNGEKEDISVITEFKDHVKYMYKNVDVLLYKIPDDKIKAIQYSVSPEMYWEGHARYIAMDVLDSSCQYVLFLDSDEIVNGKAFQAFITAGLHLPYDAMKLKNVWYWREPKYRARDYYEDSVVLIKRSRFNTLALFSNLGRHGIFEKCTGNKVRALAGVDGKAMIHHYSWVRSKDQMLRKVRAWGHRNDRKNWEQMVQDEFQRPFNGKDFLQEDREYDIVEDTFNLGRFEA